MESFHPEKRGRKSIKGGRGEEGGGSARIVVMGFEAIRDDENYTRT